MYLLVSVFSLAIIPHLLLFMCVKQSLCIYYVKSSLFEYHRVCVNMSNTMGTSVVHNLLILPENLRYSPFFIWFVLLSLLFSIFCCELLFVNVFLWFSYFFLFLNMNVPLVSFASLFNVLWYNLWTYTVLKNTLLVWPSYTDKALAMFGTYKLSFIGQI